MSRSPGEPAADGPVLRIRERDPGNPNGYVLQIKSTAGNVNDVQLSLDRTDELVCRQVFESQESFGTVQTDRPDGGRYGIGIPISDKDQAKLRACGVRTYAIMKVQSAVGIDGEPSTLSMLATFHYLPQAFSSRDLSLFRSFCERIGDDLTLLNQRDENEAMVNLLRAQDRLGTRAEITALLGHDFGHRVFHVNSALEEFLDTCGRALRGKAHGLRSFEDHASNLRKSCAELRDMLRQLRSLSQGIEEQPVEFNVGDVFNEIKASLRGVMERYSMGLEIRWEGDCRTRGMRSILLQSLYNLVINCVDAQKAAARPKKNDVHLACREVESGAHRQLEVRIWDEGSGISRSLFPDAQRIFDVGTTSKPPGHGTGTGLAVARSLLSIYFHADLVLTDRTKALFRFVIPSPSTELRYVGT